MCPEPVPANERVGVAATSHAGRKRLELFRVSTTDDDVIGLERGAKPTDHVQDVAPPLLAT